ncbi:MAG: hypothetical protein Q9192_009123, partial [Flavoplaca navasiana]
SQSGSASFEESVKRVNSRSTGLSQTLNQMDIHRKEPQEPVSKGSPTSADPPEPVLKDLSPSTEAPETVHKHSNKANIPSASTSTSSQAQIQTSRPTPTLSLTKPIHLAKQFPKRSVNAAL